MSRNSGEEIYNRVLVQAQGPDGTGLTEEVWSPATLSLSERGAPFAQPSNPSADTNTSGWTAYAGSITRDTGTFDTTPGSFRFATSGGGTAGAHTVVTQTLKKGRRYGAEFAYTSGGGPISVFAVGPTTSLSAAWQSWSLVGPVGWTQETIQWIQPEDATQYVLFFQLTDTGTGANMNFDSIQVGSIGTTLVDRRGFRRTKVLPVNAAATDAVLEQIGSVYLAGHKTTPFKGSLTVTGPGVRRLLGGQPVHPAHLLTHVGELIRFSNEIDPDTGAHGRDGRIAAVSYTHSTGQASVSIDNSRHSFEALLERYGALVGAS